MALAQLSGAEDITLTVPIGSDVADVKTAARFVQVSNQGFGLSFTLTNEGSATSWPGTGARTSASWTTQGSLWPRKPYGREDVLDRERQLRQRRAFLRGRSQSPARQLTLMLAQLAGTEDITLTVPVGSDVADVRAKASIAETWNNGFALSFMLT